MEPVLTVDAWQECTKELLIECGLSFTISVSSFMSRSFKLIVSKVKIGSDYYSFISTKIKFSTLMIVVIIRIWFHSWSLVALNSERDDCPRAIITSKYVKIWKWMITPLNSNCNRATRHIFVVDLFHSKPANVKGDENKFGINFQSEYQRYDKGEFYRSPHRGLSNDKIPCWSSDTQVIRCTSR